MEKEKAEPEENEKQPSTEGDDGLKAFYEKYAQEQARKEADSEEFSGGNN